MTKSCRAWWRNCALHVDPEILAIDRLEDAIAPFPPNVSKIRELITSLEICHHKADRWIANIVESIGSGETCKGLGTRDRGQQHSVEKVWQSACAALSAWVAGCTATSVDVTIDSVPISQMLSRLGERSHLKEWQVQRVIEKIKSAIGWPKSADDPSSQYVWLLLDGDEYELGHLQQCPDHYKEHEDYWWRTVRTIIHDVADGKCVALSMGIAIDLLMPCHWRFVTNLQIVLDAIGGNLEPSEPFAACGRNISLVPNRNRLNAVCKTLREFCGNTSPDENGDAELLAQLGELTKEMGWLAASLQKTIRLQMDPPADLRAMSALGCPDWLKSQNLSDDS